MSHGALCSTIFDELRNTKLFRDNHIWGRHISAAWTESYKSTPSIILILILASSASILSWSMLSDDLALWDSLANAFMTAGAGAGVADYTNAGLCWGSWLCSLILSSGWAIVGIWLKVTDWLEGPSPEVFLSVCSSKLVRWATLVFRDSNSSWKWASRWARSSSYMFLARSRVL